MWGNLPVSFYQNHYDKIGEPATMRDALYWKFYTGLDAIIELRQLDPAAPDYEVRKKQLKDTLPGFTPSGLLATREKDNVTVISRTGIIQFDFDNCHQYDIDELKMAIFSLPFVCYVGLSCSGQGIYALVLIAEPEKQRQYVQHCFEVFAEYGIEVDTSKGRNVNDLRYVSYDSRPLWRDDPQPLRIKHFKAQQRPEKGAVSNNQQFTGSNAAVIKWAVNEIMAAQVGQRWQTVQKTAYTIGGRQDREGLAAIEQAIKANNAFAGLEDKYLKCAQDCYRDGGLKPLPV